MTQSHLKPHAIKVAVIGAHGRMGSSVCEAVEKADDMKLVARIVKGQRINAQTLCGADVAVEFTVPDASFSHVKQLIDAGCHSVVGTTGWDQKKYATINSLLDKQASRNPKKTPHVFIAPNFALSALFLMKCAQLAAPYFESVEIVEMHHPDKLDAPSGTAIATAEKIADVRKHYNCLPLPDATCSDSLHSRGGTIKGIPVHALRLRGAYAHEEVILGNPGEQMSIRSDCFDRQSFMPGVLLAIRQVILHPGLTIGLENFLEGKVS